jgi:ABC-type uncharacterized transport system substrate-binding protein
MVGLSATSTKRLFAKPNFTSRCADAHSCCTSASVSIVIWRKAQVREVLSAARNLGLELHVLNAANERDFDAVFADIKRLRVGGLVIGAGTVFTGNIKKLAALTVRHAVPAIYLYRDFPAAGGLMSYASDVSDSYRLAGVYTGRVLKGENPAELPVVQATKFELIINLKTAKAFGITVPNTIIGRADELIE